MAKFLPFIVEKSTPENVYQTILSRSKGLNNLLVASILFLVLDKGITTVRKTATALPEMPLGKLYEELLNVYPGHNIPNEDFQLIQAVGIYVKKHAWEGLPETLKEYELSDLMSFLLVMHYIGKLIDYTVLPFENLFNGKREEVANNITPHRLFSNTGTPVQFFSIDELAAYIHFHVLICYEEGYPPVRAVLRPAGTVPPPSPGPSTSSDGGYV